MKTENIIFFSKEEALKNLKHHKNMRIAYYDNKDYENEIKRMESRKYVLIHQDYISCKKYVKCKSCKSKINTQYTALKFYTKDGIEVSECKCPVCGAELRKPSIVRKQYELINKIKELKNSKKIKYLYG